MYRWWFDDGSPYQEGVQVNHTYSSAGIYWPSLEVIDDEYATDSDVCKVYVVEVASVSSDKDSAVLCENITFTVTTNPELRPGYGDLISWSGGGTPATGSGSTFTTCWNCTGTKTVTATCGSSSKSKNVTISLPTGCSNCSGPPAPPSPSITEKEPECTQCDPNQAGYFSPISATYTLKTSCYDNCKWYAYLDTVDTLVDICRSCPANPPTVACLSDVADMNEAEACAHKKNFPHDPFQWGDRSTSNWCRDCVVVHEETHMNKDWVQDSLQPQINDFSTYLANFGINIDCGVGSSTHCATALTPDMKTLLDIKWQLHVISALLTFNSQGEADAEAAEVACYQAILDALKKKCP